MFRNKTPAIGTGFKLQPCILYIRDNLEASNVDALLEKAADIVLWVSLVVGPVSQEEETTNYFASLLRRAVQALGDISYAQAHEVVSTQAFLPTPFDDLSRQFWAHFIGAGESSLLLQERG